MLLGLIFGIALLLLAAGPHVFRAGYSSDEEITALTVNGVIATGWPALPSGVLYLRGVIYTYVAWLTGVLGTQTISSYRVVSLMFAVLALVALVAAGRDITTRPSSGWAAIFLASFQPHIAAASFARFYSIFVATSLMAIWAFYRSRDDIRRDTLFLASLAVCRLTHEFAVVLALLPLCQALCVRGDARRRFLWLGAKSVALLAAIEIVLTVMGQVSLAHHVGRPELRLGAFASDPFAWPPVHALRVAGPGVLTLVTGWILLTGVAIRKLTRAPMSALSLFLACGLLFQSGLLLTCLISMLIWKPQQRQVLILAAFIVAVSSIGAWTVAVSLSTNALLSWRLAYQLSMSTIWYPWEAVLQFLQMSLLTTIAAMLTVVRLVFDPLPEDDGLRVFALFGVAALSVMGVAGVELQWRYLLLVAPIVLFLAADCVVYAGERVGALMLTPTGILSPAYAGAIASAVLALLLVADHHFRVSDAGPLSLFSFTSPAFAAPTETEWQADVFRRTVHPDDTLVCNDELACAYLAGRVDYWLSLSDRTTGRFTAAATGIRRGFYAGSTVVMSEAALRHVLNCSTRPVALVILDTGKFDFDQSHALALQVANDFAGSVTSAGGRHVVIRFPDLQRKPICEGEGL